MNRTFVSIFTVLLLLIGVKLALQTANKAVAKNATFRMPVSVHQVTKSSLKKWMVSTGTVKARRHVTLFFQQPGRVQWLTNAPNGQPLRVGSRVYGPTKRKKGQLLARLDLREQKLAIRGLRSSLRAAREGLKATKMVIQQAVLQQRQALRSWRRSLILYRRQGLSRAMLEKAQDMLRLARIQVKTSRVQYRARLAAIAANVQQLRQQRLSLRRGKMRAPFTGFVSAMNMQRDQLTGGTQQAWIRLFDPRSLEVRSFYPLDEALHLKAGMSAEIAYKRNILSKVEHRTKAVVKAVNPSLSGQSGLVEVLLVLPAPPRWLREGMKVTSRILTKHKQNVLVLPQQALLFRSRHEVFVLSQKRPCVQKRIVQLGLRGRRKWEVVAGLKPGERVVTVGKHSLFDGACVRPLKTAVVQ